MEKLELKVSGMMCKGCENRVKTALEELDEVKEVEANHNKGIVKITLMEEIDIAIIENTIKDLGFKVIKED